MAKKIDLTKTIYELTKEYPELIEVMTDLGFSEIKKKSMRNSVGKLMTITKGAKMKKIPMSDVVDALSSKGFEIIGDISKDASSEPAEPKAQVSEPESRSNKLKAYLRRLGEGEDLKSVREDFVENFSDVEAAEIMQAEQELLEEGTPLTEVQKLCDLHSALFHGKTRTEKIANAEKEVAASLKRQEAAEEADNATSIHQKVDADKKAFADSLENIPGHPLYTLTKENEALKALLDRFHNDKSKELFEEIRQVSLHYDKKGDLLYPHLKVTYGISGPSDVMWTVDDEIRDELRDLAKETDKDKMDERLEKVLERLEEMIYKEQHILFPICADNFTEEEWIGIYKDSQDYPNSFGIEDIKWEDAESQETEEKCGIEDQIIMMPGGQMKLNELIALLNTIPMEISFIDADNINRFFNEGPKVFKRPKMALGRSLFSCHPPKIETIVRSIIDSFKAGTKDNVPVWTEKNGRTLLINYMAVRDRNGKYVGTVELAQDMEFAREYFREK